MLWIQGRYKCSNEAKDPGVVETSVKHSANASLTKTSLHSLWWIFGMINHVTGCLPRWLMVWSSRGRAMQLSLLPSLRGLKAAGHSHPGSHGTWEQQLPLLETPPCRSLFQPTAVSALPRSFPHSKSLWALFKPLPCSTGYPQRDIATGVSGWAELYFSFCSCSCGLSPKIACVSNLKQSSSTLYLGSG